MTQLKKNYEKTKTGDEFFFEKVVPIRFPKQMTHVMLKLETNGNS